MKELKKPCSNCKECKKR